MSATAVLLAVAASSGSDDNVELAVIAAAAVPVVAATVQAAATELGVIATRDLRRTLLLSQLLAAAALLTFIAAVVLGASGLTSEATAIYTALAGSTLGGLSLTGGYRASAARQYALTVQMVNSIEDRQLRDRTRRDIALEAIRSTPPVSRDSGGDSTTPAIAP
ncbi:hypothetical protein NONI108955_38285 [Nocardia ninae]|uniref:Transmembrane protein n=1 Tax=Nocardia ninae NBRC 108245 TaxID=1210091 RepID=A0A511MDJ6_9NOCA|nr:hypothetical protein [Nocardia ninae]GEM38734.1 hypothetical protein NN4_32530 [Nocardia ninae NBRC 108245]